eukprot:TRINITY_DN4726_c0_g1_i3.p2 TRINITY_DN4726_c0_g1~~TRINITY_DN4726_c0_g1_i3.p2  ORF type:complete len:228 (+),score=-0.17 TRINITY_DN4726_c0_g1_i3:960-1643(+)
MYLFLLFTQFTQICSLFIYIYCVHGGFIANFIRNWYCLYQFITSAKNFVTESSNYHELIQIRYKNPSCKDPPSNFKLFWKTIQFVLPIFLTNVCLHQYFQEQIFWRAPQFCLVKAKQSTFAIILEIKFFGVLNSLLFCGRNLHDEKPSLAFKKRCLDSSLQVVEFSFFFLNQHKFGGVYCMQCQNNVRWMCLEGQTTKSILRVGKVNKMDVVCVHDLLVQVLFEKTY